MTLGPELEALAEATAFHVASRLAGRRCPVCHELVAHEADPLVTCAECGTELVVLLAYDQVHVVQRDGLLAGDDLHAELERLADLAEARRQGGA